MAMHSATLYDVVRSEEVRGGKIVDKNPLPSGKMMVLLLRRADCDLHGDLSTWEVEAGRS